MAYKTLGCIRRTPISTEQIKKKQSTYTKRNEINIRIIINDNTFNLHNNLLNNDNRYMKVEANRSFHEGNFDRLSPILNLCMAYTVQGNLKIYLKKKCAPYMLLNTVTVFCTWNHWTLCKEITFKMNYSY